MRKEKIKIRLAAAVCTFLSAAVIMSGTCSVKAYGDISRASQTGEVYAGGIPFGLRIYTGSLTVVGFSDVDTSEGAKSPAADAGIRQGDMITKINGSQITSSEDFLRAVENSADEIRLDVKRGEDELSFTFKPSRSERDGKYKTGLWLRDSTAGIGTVTFIVPDSGEFAGLGHGVCDADTGGLIQLSFGIVSGVEICGIRKSLPSEPGELRGYFTNDFNGVIVKNTEHGVFGTLNNFPGDERLIKLGTRSEISEGEASLICTINKEEPREYTMEISKIPSDVSSDSFEIRITDETLISEAGGIVQGMSGSPIIQNGKLVGAVTHVLVNDPTRGYGIFIENMLEAAG